MGINIAKIDNIDYYRITRTWNHKATEEQRYIRIPSHKNKNKQLLLKEAAYKLALEVDEGLEIRQRASKLRNLNNGRDYFHPTGKIVGINRCFYWRHRKPSGTLCEVHNFRIRYNKCDGTHPKSTCISTQLHGLDLAFKMAVDVFLSYIDQAHNKPLKNLMMDCIQFYQHDPFYDIGYGYNGRGKVDILPILETPLQIDFNQPPISKTSRQKEAAIDQFADQLQKEAYKFTNNLDAIRCA